MAAEPGRAADRGRRDRHPARRHRRRGWREGLERRLGCLLDPLPATGDHGTLPSAVVIAGQGAAAAVWVFHLTQAPASTRALTEPPGEASTSVFGSRPVGDLSLVRRRTARGLRRLGFEALPSRLAAGAQRLADLGPGGSARPGPARRPRDRLPDRHVQLSQRRQPDQIVVGGVNPPCQVRQGSLHRSVHDRQDARRPGRCTRAHERRPTRPARCRAVRR